MWTKPPSLVALITILCCVLPFILREFYLNIMIFLLINFILVVSFRLITTTGVFSFAHIGLMSVGAYTSGLLAIRLGCSFWLTLPLGVLAAAFVSLLIGLPIVRTRGVQFFLTSYAAGQAIWWATIIFREPFGSYTGIGLVPPPNPILGINFVSSTSYYYLVLIFVLLSLVIMYRLEKSRIGDTLKSIDMNEDLCEAIGISPYRYKVMTFVIASSFAGLAGVLFTHYTGTASPNDYTFIYGMNILIFVLVGGKDSFAGPILGTLFLTVLSELLRDFLQYLPLIYGAILIVTVLFLPGGIVSLPRRVSPLGERIQMLGKKEAR